MSLHTPIHTLTHTHNHINVFIIKQTRQTHSLSWPACCVWQSQERHLANFSKSSVMNMCNEPSQPSHAHIPRYLVCVCVCNGFNVAIVASNWSRAESEVAQLPRVNGQQIFKVPKGQWRIYENRKFPWQMWQARKRLRKGWDGRNPQQKKMMKNLFAKFRRAACRFLLPRVYINLYCGVAIYQATAAGISIAQPWGNCGMGGMGVAFA